MRERERERRALAPPPIRSAERIINEPTAAALGYGLDQKGGGPTASHVLVFDLGGGTFDVSVLHIEGGLVEVKATGGDTRLGGEDFDACLTDWICAELKKKGFTIEGKTKAKAKRAAENAKRALSSNEARPVCACLSAPFVV